MIFENGVASIDLPCSGVKGIPWSLTAAILCLTVIPLLAVAWAIRLSRFPEKLVGLFYGLEVPLCLVCLFRIFLVRELTPTLAMVGTAFFVASGARG